MTNLVGSTREARKAVPVLNSSEATTTTVVAPGQSAAAVEVRGLVKRYQRADGSTITPIDDVSLSVQDGEFLVLLGPSGCGKTTLLRTIAGLEVPDAGQVTIHGKAVFDGSRGLNVPAERRRLGMIFQSYALWPHMTAFENVAYPLKAMKAPKAEIEPRVTAALTTVGIPELARQLPGRLSGGQQQRVALARALVGEPRVILFDEPLSNVDAKVREELRVELIAMQRRLRFTALYVTHDQEEAMELADRIAVLGAGRIAQLAPPKDVYERPTSSYVARFIGTANELGAKVSGQHPDGSLELRTQVGTVELPRREDLHLDDEVRLIWRPEATALLDQASASDDASLIQISLQNAVLRYRGAQHELLGTAGDDDALIRAIVRRVPHALDLDHITLGVDIADVHVFKA